MSRPKIHIVSRKLIKPSNPTPNHLQNYQLSVFDQLAPASHIKIVLYFNHGEDKAANNSQRLAQLEESLGHTLSKFYPLAGRLVKNQENLYVNCNDQGVEYLVTKVDRKLDDLLHQKPIDIESLDQLLPKEVGLAADSATSPLVANNDNNNITSVISHVGSGEGRLDADLTLPQGERGAVSERHPTTGPLVVNNYYNNLRSVIPHMGAGEGRVYTDLTLPQENRGVVFERLPATVALVAIQINLFECGGIAIGASVFHKIADTSTVVAFINGWAIANQGDIVKVLNPNFDVPSSFPLRKSMIPELPSDKELKIVARRFVFDESKIAKLKDIFKKNVTTHKEIQPTRVTLVTAVIWKALINVAQAKHGKQLRPSLLAPAMNLREKTAVVPISQSAFGNSWIPFIVRFTPAGDTLLEWFNLVHPLSNAVENTAKFIKNATKDEISDAVSDTFAKVHEEILRNNGVDVFICTSWSKLPMYEVDFGWGKPCWVL